MSEEPNVTRRTLLRGFGAAAGAGLLGSGAAGTVSADEAAEIGVEFTNLRVQEARHAWKRGYRGQPDRSLALTDTGVDARHPDVGDWTGVGADAGEGDFGLSDYVVWQVDNEGEFEAEADDPFEGIDPDDVGTDTPKMVGWVPTESDLDVPRDDGGHGTHVAGIMAGSGEASAIDAANPDTRVEEPHALLLPGDVLSYEVEAPAGTGVFASAFGDGIELTIEGPDGRQLRRSRGISGTSEESFVNNTAETPTTEAHDEAGGTRTYTVHVRATEGEALPARVGRVAVGSFLRHDETKGVRTDVEADEDAHLAFHPGVAPNASILPIVGFAEATAALAEHAEEFADTFNTRLVNMSWGWEVPWDQTGEEDLSTVPDDVRRITEGGILVVASAGNAATPATGPTGPSGPEESIAVVATGALDGIAAYSSGGTGGKNTDDEPYFKPDVTTMGGSTNQLEQAPVPGEVEDDPEHDGYGAIRDYDGKGGTSMASPQAAGSAGLVAQAMEEDAPPSIELPEPAESDEDDVFRLKQTILATASETALTAAPYHRGQQKPVYTFGGRDPYEGFGRINVGAAVDAVSRDLTDETIAGTVGLNVPMDQRAEAGYVRVAEPGEVAVDLEFSHYSGGNAGATKGDPHLDLFVYDAQKPGDAGEPNVVAREQGTDGDASLSVSVPAEEVAGDDERVFYVVAKLVNVPGLVNGTDVRAHFDLSTAFDSAGLVVDGEAEIGSSVYTGDDTARNEIDVDVLNPADREVLVRDFVPEDWDVEERFLPDSAETYPALNGTYVVFGVDDPQSAYDELTYFARSPDDVASDSGTYEFGPVAVTTETSDPAEPGTPRFDEREWVSIGGTARETTLVAEDI